MNKVDKIKEQIYEILKKKGEKGNEYQILLQKKNNNIIISKNNYIFTTISMNNFNDSKIMRSDNQWIKYVKRNIVATLDEESSENSHSDDSSEDNMIANSKIIELEKKINNLEEIVNKLSNGNANSFEKRLTTLEKQVNGWNGD